MSSSEALSTIDFEAAAERLAGVVRETPLVPFDLGRPEVELRLKMENFQETGSFKARGAWNNVSQLTPAEREAGVTTTSSGNHGKALAWAAERAGVAATIFMPEDAYPNKVEACRRHGAEVVLCRTREEAEDACAVRVADGAKLVHPYDFAGTVEGAGTVGLEIARTWPEVDVVVFCVGGGGLSAGSSLAIRRTLGRRPLLIGVEPAGAPSMTLGIRAGEPVLLDDITTKVQGLCPLYSGALNIEIAREVGLRMTTVEDEEVYAAQARLVGMGYTVEPAGAAALAALLGGVLGSDLLAGRTEDDPLRVAATVSGGNADPAQLEALRRGSA